MTWPREDSRPRISPDSRRAGLLTLVLGGLVLAGLLVCLVPSEQRYGTSKLYCGTPLSAAFKSAQDYVTEFEQQASAPSATPRHDADTVVPPHLVLAGANCVSSGRTRTSIGGGLLLLAIAGGVVAGLTHGRRNRNT